LVFLFSGGSIELQQAGIGLENSDNLLMK